MSNIKLFESKQIRTVWNEADQKWYFVVEDVVLVLTDSKDPKQYIKRMRQRDEELAKGWVQFVPTLWVETAGGKQQMACANAKGLLRIIQSIPSPKAEPFKLWLAQVGSDRLDEIENPELATQRTRELYKLKGYPDEWIEKRMRSIAIREELTGEWNNRGIKEQREYSILTAEISKATFGLTPSEYKELKKLKRENLRDHMTDLELIFSMLGEASTTAIVKTKDPKGFIENKIVAKQGGKIAGDARKALEVKTGQKVITSENYLLGDKVPKQIKGKKKSAFNPHPKPVKECAQCSVNAKSRQMKNAPPHD
jgi:DNA-damage-inducible protein D